MIINKERIYLEFNLCGFREAQKYLLEHGIKKRKLHVEQ
jgi:hypothetical protein